jgi:hypothetical protein
MQSVKIFQGEDVETLEREINDFLITQHGPQVTQIAQSDTPASDAAPRQVTITIVLQEAY